MLGILYLYIYDDKTYKLPKPKGDIFKAIPELGDKKVLSIHLLYEILNRKPNKLVRSYFHRTQLDKFGQIDPTLEEQEPALTNFINYALTTAEELSKKTDPWVIPKAPYIPNSKEKSILIKYLNDKYPLLGKDCGWVIENDIQDMNSLHQEYIQLLKQATIIKNTK